MAIAKLDKNTEILDLREVKKCLDLGANPNLQTENGLNTAMHIAAHRKDPKLSELLLEHGASINVRNKKGKTPLSIAMKEGNAAVIHTLTKNDPLTRLTTTAAYEDRAIESAKTRSLESPTSIAISSSPKMQKIIKDIKSAGDIKTRSASKIKPFSRQNISRTQ